MPDLFDSVAKITGVKMTPEIRAVLDDVTRNVSVLETCSKHDFSIPETPPNSMLSRFKCSRCGGTVRGTEKRWYEFGLNHARREHKPSAVPNNEHQ
jgi:hypothetical protein